MDFNYNVSQNYNKLFQINYPETKYSPTTEYNPSSSTLYQDPQMNYGIALRHKSEIFEMPEPQANYGIVCSPLEGDTFTKKPTVKIFDDEIETPVQMAYGIAICQESKPIELPHAEMNYGIACPSDILNNKNNIQ